MDLTSFFEDIVQPQFILSHYIMSTKFQDGSIKEMLREVQTRNFQLFVRQKTACMMQLNELLINW